VPRLCELYPGICLTTEEKARKNLSQGRKNASWQNENRIYMKRECEVARRKASPFINPETCFVGINIKNMSTKVDIGQLNFCEEFDVVSHILNKRLSLYRLYYNDY
jgi:hypothetical protein